MLAEAGSEAAATRASADAEAQRLIDAARDEGRLAAESIARSERLTSARKARALVLDARNAREHRARDAAVTAAVAFRGRPEYSRLLDALEAEARRRLGADAVIDRDPPQGGGVRAVRGSRSLDYSLPSLAERAVTLALPRVEQRPRAAKRTAASRR